MVAFLPCFLLITQPDRLASSLLLTSSRPGLAVEASFDDGSLIE
jgi:hypothetical protein